MAALIGEARPKRSPGVASSPVDDDLVVYDSRAGQGHLLNATAAHIWRLSDGTRTVAAIARDVSRAYGGPYEQVLRDVDELVKGLREVGLLRLETVKA